MSAHGGQPAATKRPIRQSLPLYANPIKQLFLASTWRATWFLLAYLVVSWVLFAVVFTAATATLALAITLLGLPLLIATAAAVRWSATAERLRLGSLVHEAPSGGYRGGYGEEPHFRPREFDLLRMLAVNAGRVVTRRNLFDSVWGPDFYGDERALDVYIRFLRKKIEREAQDPEMILTAWGVGYKFADVE